MDTVTAAETAKVRVPDAQTARLSSFGFDSVVADWYWLQAMQLVGGERGNTAVHAETIADLIDLVTTLDPWVGHPYRFAAVWLTDSERSVRRANELLERGIAYSPRDWRNRYHLGFNHFYYLEENQLAADIFETALPLEGVPNYLGALVARLRLNSGGLEAAAAFLNELVETASDEYSRAEYQKALDEIDTERMARILDAAREEFWRRTGRDIRSVGELTQGPNRVLAKLPPAHPHFAWPEWTLDPESGQIVSSFYDSRYRLHMTKRDLERRDRWRRLRDAQSESS